MAVDPDEDWAKAKKTCLDLLAARPRSTDELRQALRRKGYSSDLSEELLSRLASSGLIDDTAFAEAWVRSRHRFQGMGRKAIADELKRKGVDGSVAAQAVEEISRDDEEQRARELVRKKVRTMGSLNEETKLRRLLGVLGRKGYPKGLAYAVIRDELASKGTERALLDGMVQG